MAVEIPEMSFSNYSGKHAIKITSADDYNLTNVTFDQSGINDIETTHASGVVTLNITGGTTPTVTQTGAGTFVVVAGQKNKTVTNLPNGCEARVLQGSYTLQYEANITDGTFTYTYTPDNTSITIRITLAGTIIEPINLVLDSSDQSIPATVSTDPSYTS